ncbi:MAG: hypothetical protein IPF72_16240 [Chitinophagaceae bacterium]|nr:hypothetical protein [Chitinophagaceae bacterium]
MKWEVVQLICPDCQKGMDDNNVEYDKENTTDKRSKTRRNDSHAGDWPDRE